MNIDMEVGTAPATVETEAVVTQEATVIDKDVSPTQVDTSEPKDEAMPSEVVPAGAGDDTSNASPAKRGRGRPPKAKAEGGSKEESDKADVGDKPAEGVKRGRGRPPKKGSAAKKAAKASADDKSSDGAKRGRGRPPKVKVDKASTSEVEKFTEEDQAVNVEASPSTPKRGRGRPPKAKTEGDEDEETPKKAKVAKDGDGSDTTAKRGRGRPPSSTPKAKGKAEDTGETGKKRGRGRPPKAKPDSA